MTTCDLIAALKLYDVAIVATGDRLLIEGPEGGIVDDPDLIRQLSDRKRELLAILSGNWTAAAKALVERDRPNEADYWIGQFEEQAGIYQSDADLERRVAEELSYYEIADGIFEPEMDA